MDSFYSSKELAKLNFASIGTNVLISKKASFYGCNTMHIGSNVRIDDFCMLSGNISIADYVHISAYVALYGKAGIVIGSFCGVSPKTTIFSETDDFSGEYLISPMVPSEYRNVFSGTVFMQDYSHVGAHSVIMPAVTLGEGAVAGAFSFIKNDLAAWTINFGIPCKYYKPRKRSVVSLSQSLL